MKHAASMQSVKITRPYDARGNPGQRAPGQDSARLQGGNWRMQGFRRSLHVHDEDECRMSIAEFMGEQERYEPVE